MHGRSMKRIAKIRAQSSQFLHSAPALVMMNKINITTPLVA
jgi:hypothetical protein